MPDSIKCSKCDQEFTDEEAHKIHMNIDHGVNEVADSFQFTDSKKPLDEQEFLASNGVRGYNPNPNAGLYDNKLFRVGSSTERTSILGELYANEENPNHGSDGKFTSGSDKTDYSKKHDVFFKDSDGKVIKKNMTIRQYNKAIKDNNYEESAWGINSRDLEREYKKQQTESYASESSYDEAVTLARKILIAKDIGLPNSNFFAHNVVDYVWKEGPRDLDITQIQQAVSQAYRELGRVEESYANEETEYTGGDFCAKCGTEFEDKGECKVCNGESDTAYKSMKRDLDTLKGLGDYNPNDSDDGKKLGMSWQDGGEASDDYEVDVDEYLKTGEPFEKLPTDKRKTESYAGESGYDWDCPICGSKYNYPDHLWTQDKIDEDIQNHLADHDNPVKYKQWSPDDSNYRYESYAREFTMKDYRENEEYNAHTENTVELVKMFGTPEEIEEMNNIEKRHNQLGYIEDEDYRRRNELNKKYFPMLTESYASEDDLDDIMSKDPNNKLPLEGTRKEQLAQIRKYLRNSEEVDYDKEDEQTMGFIEQQHTEPKEDNNKELDDVDISEESIDYVYPTKASEARERSYTTEAKMVEGLEEEYDDFEDSDEEKVTETVTLRKLHGFSNESIARELHITYGVPHEEALEKVHSIEVSTNDKVAQTFFGKMYKECNESEKAELRMYSGSD